MRMAIIFFKWKISFGKDVEILKPSDITVGMQNGIVPVENSL